MRRPWLPSSVPQVRQWSPSQTSVSLPWPVTAHTSRAAARRAAARRRRASQRREIRARSRRASVPCGRLSRMRAPGARRALVRAAGNGTSNASSCRVGVRRTAFGRPVAATTEPRGRRRSKRKEGERARCYGSASFRRTRTTTGTLAGSPRRPRAPVTVDVLAPTRLRRGGRAPRHARHRARPRRRRRGICFSRRARSATTATPTCSSSSIACSPASGARLVNDVDALLVAIDKFRTSWELARAGVPTPAARVVQTRRAGARRAR